LTCLKSSSTSWRSSGSCRTWTRPTPRSRTNSGHSPRSVGLVTLIICCKMLYSLTSLSHQPRFSPPVATGRIFFHVMYLVNSSPSRLALANWWIDNDLCKLHPISRHSRLVVASLSVPAIAPVSGSDRACYLVISRSLNCGSLAQCTAVSTPHYTSLEIMLPAAPLGRQRLVTNHTERREITAFIHSTGVWLPAVMKREGS